MPKIMQFRAEHADIQIQLTTTTQHSVDKRLVISFDQMLSTGQSYYLAHRNSVASQQKVLLFRDWMARLTERG